nr:sel1 repeat domain-containing protein [Cryptomonas paramecium]
MLCVKKQNTFNPCLFGKRSSLFFSFLIFLNCCSLTVKAFFRNNSKRNFFITGYKKFKFAICRKKYKKKWNGFFRDNSIFLYKKDLKFVFSTGYKNFSEKNSTLAKKNFDLLFLGEMLEKITENDKWNSNCRKIHLKDVLTYQFDLLSNRGLKFFCKYDLKLKKKTLLRELFQSDLKNGLEDKSFFKLLAAYIKKKGKYSKEILLSDNAKNVLYVNVFNNSETNLLNRFIAIQSTSHFHECFSNFSSNIICSLIKENWNKKQTNKLCLSGQFELIFNFGLFNNQIKKQKIRKSCYKKHLRKHKNFYVFSNVFSEKKSSITLNNKHKKKTFFILKEDKNNFYLNESFGFLKQKARKKNSKKRLQFEEIRTSSFYFMQILKLKKKKYKPFFSYLRFFTNFYSILKYKKNFLPNSKKNTNYNKLKKASLFFRHILNRNIFLKNKKKESMLYLFSKNTPFPNNAENVNFMGKLNFMGINFPKNSCESFKLYKKSALLGNLDAEFSLSEMNFYGSGKKKRKDNFLCLIKASSDKNFIPNQYNYVLESIRQHVSGVNLYSCIKKLFENYLEKRNFRRAKQLYLETIVNTFFSKNRNLNEIDMIEFSEKLFYSTFNVLFGLIENKMTSVSLSLTYFNKDSGWYKLLSIVKIKNILIENKQFFLSTELAKKYENFGFIEKTPSFSSKTLKKLF